MFRLPVYRLLCSFLFVLIPAGGVALLEKRFGAAPNIWMDFCRMVAAMLSAGWCYEASRRVSCADRRKAWQLFAAGCACWGLGHLVFGYRELIGHEFVPFGGLQDWLAFLMAPLFAWGFFYLRSPSESVLTAMRKLCNLGILACAIIGIQLLVSSGMVQALPNPAPAVIFTALGWSALLPTVFAFGMVCLWLYKAPASWLTHGILLGGIGCHAVANVLYANSALHQTYHAGHSLCDYLWLLGFSWLCWAAAEELESPLPETVPRETAEERRDFRAAVEAALPAGAMLAVVALGTVMPGYFDSRVAEYLVPVMGVLICLVGLREVWTQRLEQALFSRLKASETRFRQVMECNMTGLFFWDIHGQITEANDAFLELIGYSRTELDGGRVNWTAMTPPEYAPLDKRALDEIQAGGVCIAYEKEFIRNDGTRITLLVGGAGSADSRTTGVGFAVDVSARRNAERALQEAQNRYRALAEHSAVGIWQIDMAGGTIFANPRMLEMLQVESLEDLVARSCDQFFSPESMKAINRERQKRAAGISSSYEVELIGKRGRQIPVLISGGPVLGTDNALASLIATFTDCTQQHEVQKALRASEARLHAFLENSPAIMFIKSAVGRYELVNPAFERIVGRPVSELLGKTDVECFPPEQANASVDADRRVLATGQPLQVDATIFARSGPRFAFVHKFPLRDAEGVLTGLGGIVSDITERHDAEQALRRSEERYRMLVDNARDAIFTVSPEGLLTSLNPATEAITGFPISDWLSKSFVPLIVPEDQQRSLQLFHAALRGEKLPPFELRLRASDGGVVLLEFTVTHQMEDGKITALLGIGRDITLRRQLEEQLRQAQKMESIGQLAGGVAHDFNNLLTVVQGNASLMLMDENLGKDVVEMAREISEAADRAAGLTRQLLAFSRRQLIQARDMDINEVVANLGKMLGRLLGEDIALRVESSSSLPMIHGDPGMVEQVILNLAINARDSMPRGGRLTIGTKHVEISHEIDARNPEARPGHFVQITVSDSGSGIAPEHLSRIFEPFFTTKDVGKGTGLGLATVYGIVKQHRGWIEVKSEQDKGTIFGIYLPVSEERKTAAPQLQEAGLAGGSETILLVEDEPPVREIVRVVLKRLGYKVIEAASGAEALRVWDEHRDEIDLLFTDIVLPDGLSGPQLADLMRESVPHLKVLFTSGYSTKLVMKEGRHRAGMKHLQKPYHPKQLADAVRAAFEAKEDSASSESTPA